MLVYYTVEQLREALSATAAQIRLLARLGILPSVSGRTPYIFIKKDIDKWVEEGNVDKYIKEYDHSDYIIE